METEDFDSDCERAWKLGENAFIYVTRETGIEEKKSIGKSNFVSYPLYTVFMEVVTHSISRFEQDDADLQDVSRHVTLSSALFAAWTLEKENDFNNMMQAEAENALAEIHLEDVPHGCLDCGKTTECVYCDECAKGKKCRHENSIEDCDHCMHESDLAYDAARESR